MAHAFLRLIEILGQPGRVVVDIYLLVLMYSRNFLNIAILTINRSHEAVEQWMSLLVKPIV